MIEGMAHAEQRNIVNKFYECGPSIYWINFVGPPDFIININFQKDLSDFVLFCFHGSFSN